MANHAHSSSTPLWQPSEGRIAASQMTALMRRLERDHDVTLKDYAALHAFSVDQLETFWSELWGDFNLIALEAPDKTLSFPKGQDGRMEHATWFEGARLNYAANCLWRRDDAPALICRDERGRRESISYYALYDEVAKLVCALEAAGVTAGDRVAGIVPNSKHAVIGLLASASLGAIWSSCSPDFGEAGILDRFSQIEPKVLIACDGYSWGGKAIDIRERLGKVSAQLESVVTTVVFGFLEDEPDLEAIEKSVRWETFLENDAYEIDFRAQAFDHPLYILYSSGTTGVPKCIVHGAGGSLLQHLKEHRLHVDLDRDDVLFFYTTCGWMMWNWLVSGLATGSTLVLYDGMPLHPSKDALWRIIDEDQVSVFGTSARYIATCEKEGLKPGREFELSALRAILSTGSALSHESFDYVYEDIGSDLMLGSISGGTDIVSCFALSCPIKPVYRGELQCLGLGMDVAVFDEAGEPVVGEKGELVCRKPFPCMPVKFWNDPEGTRFHGAYFEEFDNIWAHGDFAELTPNGGVIIHGRSDALLKPGGVRIGTAEIYRQVEKVEAVKEALCIGQQWDGDMRLVLFVTLKEGHELDEALAQSIRTTVRENATPRHVPSIILEAPELPRTRSGKLVELAVTDVVHGRPVKNKEALANPDALAFFESLEALSN
ncbi:acetoacetate--CoA ligase [Larsenimonas suaedae]|uniref:Acetoacetate--CoA ligase n=1 Tax=Larsenimonas suaedae TaxID=1851019 RepID=A0ABU1GTH7_9GAMM|nr:acetoacetate--CoA ligase [Larsenimonas suaedae]MCM2972501.1 acetoacetate--CoA ligase [Larsenimonas suaedae]MDR5894703.1 acetoacetate--CoA ligase [Larsenimonas suaedae]